MIFCDKTISNNINNIGNLNDAPKTTGQDIMIKKPAEFNKLVDKSNIPIYSIGGMTKNDIPSSFDCGAIGIASQRAIWDI